MTMPVTVERTLLGENLSIARALTGLWQIADLERDGRTVDASAAAKSELIARRYRKDHGDDVQFCTKWV
jgi:hypothetical protein